MTYRGKISGGVVVLAKDAQLPEGTMVKVEPIEESSEPLSSDPLYRLGELAVPTGIPDLASNIDHYLYGHPKAGNGSE